MILVVASPVHLVLPFVGFNRNALPLTLLLILIGIYGLLVTAKLYERQLFHLLRARKLRSRLDELYPEAQVLALHDLAEKEHTTRHASFFYIRLNNIWLGLYALIAGLGMVYTMICLFR